MMMREEEGRERGHQQEEQVENQPAQEGEEGEEEEETPCQVSDVRKATASAMPAATLPNRDT